MTRTVKMHRVCQCNAGYSCDECGKRIDESARTMWTVTDHREAAQHFCNETCTYKYLGIEPPKSQLSFPERPTVPKLDAKETWHPVAENDVKTWYCHCGRAFGCSPGHCLNVPA